MQHDMTPQIYHRLQRNQQQCRGANIVEVVGCEKSKNHDQVHYDHALIRPPKPRIDTFTASCVLMTIKEHRSKVAHKKDDNTRNDTMQSPRNPAISAAMCRDENHQKH